MECQNEYLNSSYNPQPCSNQMNSLRENRKNRDLSQMAVIAQIHDWKKKYRNLSDSEIKTTSLEIKYELSSGTKLTKLLPQAFALVSEAARRSIGMEHFDVQLYAGIQLARQRIAEMQTGEGKTLTATLPCYLFALAGKGVHVSTVNDYLAKRDCETLKPVYELLGLTVGAIQSEDPPEARVSAYAKDITYGTSKEFGFDFLRDRLALRAANERKTAPTGVVMRGLHFALVDEADSILIDEARTPLVIGMVSPGEEAIERGCYRWAARHAKHFEIEEDFRYDEQTKQVHLKPKGIHRLRKLPQTEETKTVGLRELYKHMETAIKVYKDFQKDRNYAIRFDKEEKKHKIVIIDEFTGRIAEGRQWQQGIHQAIEAKERVPITPATRHAARITVQELFRRYKNFAGMTGTAWTSRRELKKVYKKKVIRIPSNRESQRKQFETRVFKNAESKFKAIGEETREMIAANRAVLIGTRSVEISETLSNIFGEMKIKHRVLNAKFLEKEAEIVALAGEIGKVTIATNMAGRGTDIKLDSEVEAAGGLHVILTEFHESARIDRQLFGRCGRQGDHGSHRTYLSLEDDILETGLGKEKSKRLLKRHSDSDTLSSQFEKHFFKAQNRTERKHLVDRMILVRQNRERNERQREMGLDPYLDLPE